MQNNNDPNKRKLDDILFRYDLIQHVQGPTHLSGNTIDLIMTRSSDSLANGASAYRLISDHFLVTTDLNIGQPPTGLRNSSFRKTRDIDLEKIKSDIRTKLNMHTNDLDSLTEHFHSTMESILDSHAPVQHRKSKAKPFQPWYDTEAHEAKRTRRAYERKWKRNPGYCKCEEFKGSLSTCEQYAQ